MMVILVPLIFLDNLEIFTPLTSYVALLITFSIFTWSFLDKEFQITYQSSKCGLTSDIYRAVNVGFLSRKVKVLYIIPRFLFAFFTIFETCCVNFNLLSMVTPRSNFFFDSMY